VEFESMFLLWIDLEFLKEKLPPSSSKAGVIISSYSYNSYYFTDLFELLLLIVMIYCCLTCYSLILMEVFYFWGETDSSEKFIGLAISRLDFPMGDT
jgi:hypothetical protein